MCLCMGGLSSCCVLVIEKLKIDARRQMATDAGSGEGFSDRTYLFEQEGDHLLLALAMAQ